MIRELRFGDRRLLAGSLAESIGADLAAAIAERGAASLVVSAAQLRGRCSRS